MDRYDEEILLDGAGLVVDEAELIAVVFEVLVEIVEDQLPELVIGVHIGSTGK